MSQATVAERQMCRTCPFGGPDFRPEDFFIRGPGADNAPKLAAFARRDGRVWKCHETTPAILSDEGEPCVGFRAGRPA